MIEANIKITIDVPVTQVWQKVTDFGNQDWRSDLTHAEMLSDRSFVEVAKNGTKTEFGISLVQPNQRLKLQLENDYISGQWIGLFCDQGTQTTLDFTELVRCKRWWLHPFVGKQLRSMQRQYMRDLLSALGAHEIGSVLRG